MAIKQVVPILITLQGDGVATTFTYALGNMYQAGVGGSIPFGTAGVVPSSVVINNPPAPVTSSTVDANGNITITFTSALTNNVQYTLEVDLVYNSGAATSSSATQSMNVNVTGGTITATDPFAGNTGSAVPAQAAYMGGKNAGNLVGIAVDASGNVGVNVIGALPAGSATIGAVTQASGPWTQNLTQVGGSSVTLGSKTSTNSIPVVIASDQAAVTVAQATAANLNATVVGTGTFAVQAAQSGTWNIGTLTTITNPVTVVGDVASGASNAGNPVKVGGAFNTTQPTVTNGQIVDAQFTARGAQIVATGVDAFNVANSGTFAVQATQSGTWNIGTVTTLTSITNAVTVSQGTAANLNATVVGTGTFAVQAAQSGNWSVRLQDGSGNGITSTASALDVNLKTSAASVTVAQATAANLNATVVQGTAAAVTAGWPVTNGQTNETTAAWTSATGLNTTLALTVTGYGAVIVSLNQGTTISGGAVSFEVSDTIAGTNWYAIQGTQINSFSTNSVYTLVASTNQGFQFDVTGAVQFRVRLSTAITGTATVNVGIAAQAIVAATEITIGQSAAANLNATVVGTGTFAVQATQSGNWTSRIVGNGGATLDIAQGGGTAATNAVQVAGVYNSGGITVSNGNGAALQIDASGFLKVNVAAGSSGNAAASATGSAVPANAGYTGVNVGGTLRGWTAVNPSGAIYAGQIDLTSIAGSTTSTAATGVLKVGIVGNAGAAFDQAPGSTAPANAIQIGGTDGTNTRAVNLNVKGTQGTYAVAVQELKDSGRTFLTFPVDAATLVTSEALISVNVNKGGTLQGAATTYTVTSGKTFRIQSISASVQGTNSTVAWVKVRVRAAASVTSSSPIIANVMVSNTGATNSVGFSQQEFPDGLEIAAGQQIGISQIGGSTNGSVTVCLVGYEY